MQNKKRSSKSGTKRTNGRKDFKGQYDASLKREDRRADEAVLRDSGKHDNAWQWYAQNPQLVKDYASYPFGVALGTTLATGIPSVDNKAFSGIMTLSYVPTIGVAQDANSPVNIAMRNIYSFVRHANSGHTNYEAPDLMMYMLAMDSVYMYHAFLKRAAQIILDYSTLNRYYPEALLLAMGLNPADMREHINDLRGYINVFGVKAGSMVVPNSMSYMARHSWMTSYIYLDSSTAKAQTYMYVPGAYMVYTLTEDTSNPGNFVGGLKYNRPSRSSNYMGQSCSTFNDLITFGNQLLDAIVPVEDLNIMSGDILKAFGQNGVVQLTGIAENQVILPEYNREVLSQMENSVVLKARFNEFILNSTITQETALGTGFLKANYDFQMYVRQNGATLPVSSWVDRITPVKRYFLNFHEQTVTPEMVMVASRNMLGITGYSAGKTDPNMWLIEPNIEAMGSEVIMQATTWTLSVVDGSVALGAVDLGHYMIEGSGSNSTLGESLLLTDLATASQFDWHPFMFPALARQVTDATILYQPPNNVFGDIDFYTSVDVENLKNMHQVALLSEFSVPQMGVLA